MPSKAAIPEVLRNLFTDVADSQLLTAKSER